MNISRYEKKTTGFVRLLGLLSVWLVICAFCGPVAGYGGFLPGFLCTAAVLIIYFAGYFLQYLSCKILRYRRPEDDGSYESNVKFVKPGMMAIPFILAVIPFFVTMYITDMVLKNDAGNTGAGYDPHSAVPLFIACAVIPVFLIGAVMWFIPSGRILSVKSIGITMIFMMIACVLTMMADASAVMPAICLSIYATVAAFAVNQNWISKNYRGAVVSFITPAARRDNGKIVGVLLIITVLLFFATSSVLTGFGVLIKFLLVRLFGVSREDMEQIYDEHTGEYNYGDYILREAGTGSESLTLALTFLFCILLLTVALFFILHRTKEMKAFFKRIAAWLESLISLWFGSGRKRTYDDSEELDYKNYRDTVKKYKPVIGGVSEHNTDGMTYKTFLGRLHSYATAGEKLGYAYAVMVSVMRRKYAYVKISDTPRELCAKISANTVYSQIDGITDAFETVAYRDYMKPDDAKLNCALETVCGIIRVSLDA